MTHTQLGTETSVRPPTPALDPSAPFSARELSAALYLPHRAIDLFLTDRERWLANVERQYLLPLLLLVMLVTSCVYSIPYGAVLGAGPFWQIAALYLGSVLICVPSLHVFSGFLGVRVSAGQTLALAILTSTVASLFSFGFFPILWFLSATMAQGSSSSSFRIISTLLLTVSLGAGLLQLGRCLRDDSALLDGRRLPSLVVLWQGLVVFITYRMGLYLGIT